MDLGNMFSNILGQREACPSCGELNSINDLTCNSCSADLRTDDPTLSVVGGMFKNRKKVPLSQSPNYILLNKIAAGIQNGSVTDVEYRVGVKKLLGIAHMVLKAFESPDMREASRGINQLQKIIKRDLQAAFIQFEKGLKRMENYPASGSLADVREGAALAERAFQMLDRIEDRSNQVHDGK